MRTMALAVLAAAMTAGGCAKESCVVAARTVSPITDTVVSDGLSATIVVTKERYAPGEYIDVYVRVTNLTDRTITIPARTEQPVYVTMYRETPLGYQRLADRGAGMRIDEPWVLPRGAQKVFSLPVVVDETIPTDGYLRLVAKISGRPRLQPAVTVWILPQEAGDYRRRP